VRLIVQTIAQDGIVAALVLPPRITQRLPSKESSALMVASTLVALSRCKADAVFLGDELDAVLDGLKVRTAAAMSVFETPAMRAAAAAAITFSTLCGRGSGSRLRA